MNDLGRFIILMSVLFVPQVLAGQGSVFDAIQPGKSTISDVHTRFGDPVRSESPGDFKLEHFNDEVAHNPQSQHFSVSGNCGLCGCRYPRIICHLTLKML